MFTIPVTWTVFKQKIGIIKPFVEIIDISNVYNLVYSLQNIQIVCRISRDGAEAADQSDYESNYQSRASALISSRDTIIGNTDGSGVGNTGDRLKVDATVSGVTGGVVSAYDNKVKVIVLQTPIVINSLTVYNTLYTYSGTGSLIGFNAEFNSNAIVVKLTIDGQIVFDGVSIAEFNGFNSTADTNSGRQAGNGIKTNSSSFDWSLKLPIAFTSNVTISAKVATGGLLTRSFQQGIVYIDKVT